MSARDTSFRGVCDTFVTLARPAAPVSLASMMRRQRIEQTLVAHAGPTTNPHHLLVAQFRPTTLPLGARARHPTGRRVLNKRSDQCRA